MAMASQVKKELGGSSNSSGPGSVGSLMEVKKEPGVFSGTSSAAATKAELASKLKLTLVQAWGERWTEIQWAIQLKKLLAAYSSESVDIAEILMQQALVGSSPNSLILSYLKHSVLSQIISFHTVLKHITEFEDFNRPYCVLAILHLAEVFGSKISLSPCQESPIQMVRTMLRLVHWLVKILVNCMQRMQDSRSGQMPREYFVIMDNSSRAITNILERGTVQSLLKISRADNAEAFREFEQTEMNACSTLSHLPNIKEDTKEKINTALGLLATKLEDPSLNAEPVLEVIHAPIYPTITGLVAMEAILNSGNDLQPFVQQVLLVSRLMKLSMPQLCLELFRACFMGFLDTADDIEDLQWATFTFLKVPHILVAMKQHMPDSVISTHVEYAVKMLLEYSYLLDQTDIKLKCDMLPKILKELTKVGILSDSETQMLSQIRAEQRSRLSNVLDDAKNLIMVTHAETTVTSILKSLDSDPLKTSESMVKVLSIMHQGYSFDILCLAASGTGRLGDFIKKLIRVNEIACQSSGESVHIPYRNHLFDITFLMIIGIFQQNGIESALSCRDNEYSLVVQWAKRWLPEEGRYKNSEVNASEDQEKVDCLIKMMLNSAQEIAPCWPIANWKELIMILPCAVQEILFAMEHKSLSFDKVRGIIDHIRKQSTKSLVVVCVTYLCSYINMVGASARVKPMEMLKMFASHLEPSKLYGSSHASDNKQPVQVILDNIMFNLLPEGHELRPVRRYELSNSKLSSETMTETLGEAFRQGWLNIRTLHTLEQLLALRGPDWFCEQMVEHLMKQSHIDDMSQSISLALAILHFDLERLTISLLQHVLPHLLTSAHSNALTDPRGYCLAKLCVLAITATQTSKARGQKDPYVRRLHKRTIQETDLEEELEDSETPTKLRKLSEPQLTFSLEEFNLEAFADKEDGGEALPTFDMKEPLNKALMKVFVLMSSILQTHSLTPRTWFIVSFLQEAIKCGGQHTRFILQFMPQNMLSQLMRSLPGVFTDDQILRICDLSTVLGRKMAAKAVCNNTQTTPLDLFD